WWFRACRRSLSACRRSLSVCRRSLSVCRRLLGAYRRLLRVYRPVALAYRRCRRGRPGESVRSKAGTQDNTGLWDNPDESSRISGIVRVEARVEGVVQGVGFRPYAHALARELGLAGRVGNDGAGVFLELEGDPGLVE